MKDELDDVYAEADKAIGMDGQPLFDLNAPEGPAPQPNDHYEFGETKLPNCQDMSNRELVERRALLKLNIEGLEEDRDNRLTEIAPANGWGGSNDSTRKLSRDKAALEDEVCNQIGVLTIIKRRELAAVDAELEIRDQARRAADQDLRKREADQRDTDLTLRQHDQALRETELTEANKSRLPFRLTGTSVQEQFNQAKALFG